MKIKEVLSNMLMEISATFDELEENALQELEQKIKAADKIFVAGAGRSLMMIRGFAIRLMHMGFEVYVVGETVTPALEKTDLLLIASGSGETSTLSVIAQKCKKIGAELALITTNPNSSIGQLADCVVKVRAASTKVANSGKKSVQPGANTFEQSVLLIGDAIVIDIISTRTIETNNIILMKKHANLE